MIERKCLILVGASIRAAAFSSWRAGYEPIGFDLFADRDLRAHASVSMIPRHEYPHRLPEYFAQTPPAPWMYTGGLENHPALIDALAAQRPLWGCDGKSLRVVRTPERLRDILRREGIAVPELRIDVPETGGMDRWLTKPRRGSGGTGISFWDGKRLVSSRDFYFQKWIAGRSVAAIYCARPSQTQLLGVTEQLVGVRWLGARPFAYCGSIGPLELPGVSLQHLQRLGQVLADQTGLRGFFGVDLVEHDGCYYVIEVNPRYTASVEVLEYATGQSLFLEHAAVFDSPIGTPTPPTQAPRMVGKAILYATRRFTFPDSGPWDNDVHRPADEFRHFGDIPMPGSALEPGWPVLTLFAEGESVRPVRDRLRQAACDTAELLGLKCEDDGPCPD
jgi:predicted ATP-grasp superfamily ATP-dependent carboligase